MMHVAFGSIATRSNQQQVQAMSANVPIVLQNSKTS